MTDNNSNWDALINNLKDEMRSEASSSKQVLTYLRFKDGDSATVRFLPPVGELDSDNTPFRKLLTHWGLGANGRERIYCPKTFGGNDCLVCRAVSEAYDSGDEDEITFARRTRARSSYMFQAYVRETGETVLWEVSHMVYSKIRSFLTNTHYGARIFGIDNGFDFEVTRKGSGLNTDYELLVVPQMTPLADTPEEVTAILSGRVALSTFFKKYDFTSEELNGFMDGSLSPHETRLAKYSAENNNDSE